MSIPTVPRPRSISPTSRGLKPSISATSSCVYPKDFRRFLSKGPREEHSITLVPQDMIWSRLIAIAARFLRIRKIIVVQNHIVLIRKNLYPFGRIISVRKLWKQADGKAIFGHLPATFRYYVDFQYDAHEDHVAGNTRSREAPVNPRCEADAALT